MTSRFTCDAHCGKEFANLWALNRHLRDLDIGSDRQCGLCGISFSKEYNLQRHLRSIHGPVEEGAPREVAQEVDKQEMEDEVAGLGTDQSSSSGSIATRTSTYTKKPHSEDLEKLQEPVTATRTATVWADHPLTTNIKASPRESPFESSTSPVTMSLDDALSAKNFGAVSNLILHHFDHVAIHSWQWLRELSELGYGRDEIAEILIQDREESPWIHFDQDQKSNRRPLVNNHVQNCVHSCAPILAAGIKDDDLDRPFSPFDDTLQDTVVALRGLAGVLPDSHPGQSWNGEVIIVEKNVAAVTYLNNDDFTPWANKDNMRTALIRTRVAVERLCTAACLVQERGRCCNAYTNLRLHLAGSVIELQSVQFGRATLFLDALERANTNDPTSIADCASIATALLKFMSPLSTEWQANETVNQLHRCALAAQLLSLSFVAYCQAHVGVLDLFCLAPSLGEVRLLGLQSLSNTNEHLTVRLVSASCMGSMLGAPLLVTCTSESERKTNTQLDVLAAPQDIIDTWGPGSFVMARSEEQTSEEVLAILIGCGAIYPVGSDKLHWSRDIPTLLHHGQQSFKVDQKILIGASMAIGATCTVKENVFPEKCFGFGDVLGTSDPHWEHQQREFGMQVGQYLLLSFNTTWAKRKGVTLKELYLNQIVRSIEDLAILEAPYGLQVSVCSGLARRVKMRTLLADLLPAYLQRKVPKSKLWQKLQDDFSIIGELRNGCLLSLLQDIYVRNSECYDALSGFIRSLILEIKDTGIDRSGDSCVVAWIPSDPCTPLQCVKFTTQGSNFWTKILEDSSTCATFAYFTTSCLQIQGHGCRKAEQTWRREMLLLETEVRPYWESKISTPVSTDCILENGQTYLIGKPAMHTGLQLRAQVLRPSLHDDPCLRVCPSAIVLEIIKRLSPRQSRKLLLLESFNAETDLHRVFVTSRGDLGFALARGIA